MTDQSFSLPVRMDQNEARVAELFRAVQMLAGLPTATMDTILHQLKKRREPAMTDPDLPTALMAWDQTPGDNHQRMEAVLAAVALNRAYRTEGNLMEAEIEAVLSVTGYDRDQTIAVLSAAADTRNAHALHLAQTRSWPPVDCHDPDGCEEHHKCVRIAGCCAHVGEVRG